MSNQAVQHSPLVEVAVDEPIVDLATIKITEKPFWSHFILRGLLSDSAFTEAVKTILNVELPATANTVIEKDGLSVLWMSPDQWLLLTDSEDMHAKVAMLSGALEDVFASINDVSGGQTIINIQGDKVLEVMNKGTTFDVHPSVFGSGQCAQTVFAKMNVLIYPKQEDNHAEFDLIVRRSFADFLGRWLINACIEYKGPRNL